MTATTIYAAPQYILTVAGDTATLSSGTKSQTMPLRHGDDIIPAPMVSALKKGGQNPADYFAVAGRYVLRRAALAAWTAAVDARIAERKAEGASKAAALAADIAARGQRALVLHGSFLLNAALAWVRPMDAAESARFAPELRATGKVAMGEWTALNRPLVDQFLAGKRSNDGWLPTTESVVILISEEEWGALESGNLAVLEAARTARAEKESAEAARIESARAEAEMAGEPVEVDRVMDECDGTEQECSFDLIRRMIRPDGSRFVIRTHCH